MTIELTMKKFFIMLILGFLLISCTPVTEIAPLATNVVSEDAVVDTSPTTTLLPTASSDNLDDSPEPTMLTSTPEANPLLPGIEIFSFSGEEPAWYTVDDDVMGGVSSSTVDIVEPDILLFSGTMSLDNNGGFSSVRSEWTLFNLSDFDGVLMRVLGDGNLYRLRIRSATIGSEISYNALFETSPDTWGLVYIPFESMVPTYRGFIMEVD